METKSILKKYLCRVVSGLVWILFVFNGSVGAAQILSPTAIIRLPEKERAILVEKKTQTLFVYASRSGAPILEVKMPCSTGEIAGDKQKAGDKKTPEGVYFMIDVYEDRYLSPIYGKKAFPLDFPNLMDQRKGKEGSAIWIHGTNKTLKPMDSNGCVAMENADILSLADYVSLDATPVILVEDIEFTDQQTLMHQEQAIIRMLDGWIEAMEKGTYHDYLSFYAHDYLPAIQWWPQWLDIREKEAEKGGEIRMAMENTGLYQYKSVVVAIFDHVVMVGDEKKVLGRRKLFLENRNPAYRIVGETYQRVEEAFRSVDVPLLAVYNSSVKRLGRPDLMAKADQPVMPSASIKKKSDVRPTPKPIQNPVPEMVHQWLTAWSTKDIKRYAAFYADDFRSDGMDKKTWVERKRFLAEKNRFIRVTGRDFQVRVDKDRCEVSFFQDYRSSILNTQGVKTLHLIKKGGAWKIYRESWKEK